MFSLWQTQERWRLRGDRKRIISESYLGGDPHTWFYPRWSRIHIIKFCPSGHHLQRAGEEQALVLFCSAYSFPIEGLALLLLVIHHAVETINTSCQYSFPMGKSNIFRQYYRLGQRQSLRFRPEFESWLRYMNLFDVGKLFFQFPPLQMGILVSPL